MSCFNPAEYAEGGSAILIRPVSESGICQVGMLAKFLPEESLEVLKTCYADEAKVVQLFNHMAKYEATQPLAPELSMMGWESCGAAIPFKPVWFKSDARFDVQAMFEGFPPFKYIAVYYSQDIGWVCYDMTLQSLWWPVRGMFNPAEFVEDFHKYIRECCCDVEVPASGKYAYQILTNLDRGEFLSVLNNITGTGVRVVQYHSEGIYGGIEMLLEFPCEYLEWLSGGSES